LTRLKYWNIKTAEKEIKRLLGVIDGLNTRCELLSKIAQKERKRAFEEAAEIAEDGGEREARLFNARVLNSDYGKQIAEAIRKKANE